MRRKWFVSVMLMTTFCCMVTGTAFAAVKRPATATELALYTGSDRQQILEEGAKKEGKLVFYTVGIVNQAVRPVIDAFQKKYPYLKVEIWRAGSNDLLPRILEEYRAGKHQCDVIECTQLLSILLQREGMILPFISPTLKYVQDDAIMKAPGQAAFLVSFRENGLGLGYNTKLITKGQLPKTYQDLLDPKWKGKSGIAGSETGVYWLGTMLNAYGEDFVKKIAQQKFDVHMVSARAILDMVINGEYAFSPTIFESHVENSKDKGAPCDWVPLEPVHINVGQIAMYKYSSHPYASLLFIDFELSKESAVIHKEIGYNPTRKDVPGAVKTYKKFFGVESVEEGIKWKEAFDRLFLKHF